MSVLFQAAILGILEGLTEFLPISSTGHLIVAEEALGFSDPSDIFTVVIQLGAVAAVIWYFRHDLRMRLHGLKRRDPAALIFWKLLVIATIPAGIAGLLLDSSMDNLTTPTVVASALIIGGVILWLVDRRPVSRNTNQPDVTRVSTKQAWLVGLGQCLALVPGVSRSGATIISGLAVGIDRATATAFSFYLSIPVLLLASGFKLIGHREDIAAISGGVPAILVGTIFAFATALLAISWLLRYIAHHNFQLFAYYRILFGVIILLWLA